jgi:flagellar hook-associated protein 2
MRAENMRLERFTRRRQHAVWRQEDLRGTMSHLDAWRAENTGALSSRLIPPAGSPNPFATMTTTVANTDPTGNTTGFSVTASNAAQVGSFTVEVVAAAQRDTIRGSEQFRGTATNNTAHPQVNLNANISTLGVTFGSDTSAHVSINGRNVLVNANDTIQSFMNRVNNTEGIGARISFDAFRGNFTLESTRMGEDATIRTGTATTVPGGAPGSGVDGFGILAAMGLDNIGASGTTTAADSRFRTVAQDAHIIIDGDLDVTSSSTRFELEGLGLTLSITEAAEGETFTVDTQRDVSTAMETIADFVRSYNELIRHLNNLHTTARPRAGGSVRGAFFEPLTDEQRAGMSDREIERWEEQARTGMLHRDDDIRRIQADMRRWMMEGVDLGNGQTLSLHQIGITTGYGQGPERHIGMLQINEDVLRNALEGGLAHINPNITAENIERMFTRPPGVQTTNAQRIEAMPEAGIAFRLNFIIENATGLTGSLRDRVGIANGHDATTNRMSRQIQAYDSRLEQMQRWLQRRESHFFAMFARMEQAMAQSQAQMDSIFAFAGGGM